MWSTAASWVALLALAAVLTRHYNPELFNKLTGHVATRTESTEATQRPAAKRQKPKRTHASRLDSGNSGASTPTSATEDKANKRRKLVSTPVDNTVVPQTSQGQYKDLARDDDNELSNKEFAQQLARAQAGTKLEPSKAQGASKKERRAARQASQPTQTGFEASGISTEASSTTGRDADDDLSQGGSPSSGPVSTAPTVRAADVSDMLEAPAAKPTTMRLTNVKDAVAKNVTKPIAKAFEPVLSKKQRQRQAKKAEEKARIEESNRTQEAKKQAQLRTARMAEGNSNQTKANSFTAKQNAWQQGKPASVDSSQKPLNAETGPLLDTFEKPNAPGTQVNGAVTSEPLSEVTNSVPETANLNEVRQEKGDRKTAALGASGREKIARPGLETQPSWADEVNEEEQDKWAKELAQEEQWEPVTSKKGKKKGKRDNETSSEASSSFARPTIAINRPATNGNKENGIKPRNENANRFQSFEQVADPLFEDAGWEA
ncbi:hypothetical protein PV05_08443 [Exophiala xenobiotica]|uniref:Inner centromere protein ARK-binding domain-containing protein n=1 Tax=Exophiala xenobiotica TaxID=348802 RepID=A0A0D2BK35_9EURO|nr:uncharacterized protein PV05_08443 [Exophiala xenobiotica]KIW52826.1 hypothetical protein PV05_08443 [Exophiala xenobiotica]